MDDNDGNGGDIWEGLEDIVTLPKLPEQESSSIVIASDHVNEVLEVDQQHQDPFLGLGPMDCFSYENEAEEETIQYRHFQFQQDLKHQETFIRMQEKRMLGGVDDSAYKMDMHVSELTSSDGSLPIERKSKEQAGGADKRKQARGAQKRKQAKGAEKRKQSSAASTSTGKLTPIEMWANSLLNQDQYGRITVVVRKEHQTFDVLVDSELSTIADVKSAIRSYMILVQADVVAVERIVLSDSSGVVFNDRSTLRELNTTEVRLMVLPM